MNRNKTPLIMPSRNASSFSSDKPKLTKITSQDYDPSSFQKIKGQIIDKISVKKDSPFTEGTRVVTRPLTDSIQKEYKIRSGFQSKTPYNNNRKALCKTCRASQCACAAKRTVGAGQRFEEIDSEPDEKFSVDKLKWKGGKGVLLIKSVYSWRPPTVLFDYPEHCHKPSRVSSRVFVMKEEEVCAKPLTFKVNDGAVSYNCFLSAFLHAGFEQTSGSSYNIAISGVPKPENMKEMNVYQKINHFPGIWQLGRKDNLWRNMLKMRRKHGKCYEFCPYTYLLPEDFNRLQADREENPKSLWILKPAALSCGRGIKMLSSKSKLSSKKSGYIVSKYISNPHTINGYKYDLRIYVGVISFDPLKVYIYNEGLARFATEKYSVESKSLKKRYIHLTNFSVNKKSSKFVKNTNASSDGEGSKWSLTALKKKYAELGIDSDLIFSRIEDIIIKTMIGVEPYVVNSMNQGCKSRNNCFETYGFDIIIDDSLKPWLLEVNVCPSLASSSPLDKKIKTSLMCDIFTLAGVIPYDRVAHEKELDYIKSSRLFGFDKSARFGHKNISALISCTSLEEHHFSYEDLEMLADSEEDSEKSGDFKRIFPLKSNIDTYCGFFEVVRYNNTLLWKHMKANSNVLDNIHKLFIS